MLPCRTDLILYKQVLFASEKRNIYKKKRKKKSQEYEKFETFFFFFFLSRVKFC